ncbi:glycosyltransferase [Absicoccus intestinalis]|uniref:Glycosyltransferase n=1 Tax=Absicoccus intestinalis TaxID=2926319 RepID=A0ABU4WPP6_9FIRM|nr:glycosyltransferase [Absicoccus sp. CLA-KB-P134]MDX8417490.1 glycosyltransferase [Absicoccus sp. CLA-KB-P134]
MYSVAVLMSTYNGAAFIEEQIESIFQQKDVKVTLFVRDDGSNDDTIAIVQKYQQDHPITILPFDQNVGPGMSFMKLLFHVMGTEKNFDYYAFSDQDDIWLPEKLIRGIEKIGKGPTLYCSNQWLYCDGKKEQLRYDFIPDQTLVGHISKNDFSGCTMIMNRSMAQCVVSIPCPPKSLLDHRMHDAWIALIAILVGQLVYDPRSYILYRIHSNNTVGIQKSSLSERIKDVTGMHTNKSKYRNIRSNTAKQLLKGDLCYKQEDKELLYLLANYQADWKIKNQLLRIKSIYQKSGESSIVYKMKVLANII